MLRKNPFFETIWQEVNKKRLLTFFLFDKGENEASAHYNSIHHYIGLAKDQTLVNFMGNILFETINALQNERFKEVNNRVLDQSLSQEQFTMLNEWIETQTAITHHKIAEYGVTHLKWSPKIDDFKSLVNENPKKIFAIVWQNANRCNSIYKNSSHADFYRREFERITALI